jgi:hypothetical protein
MKSGLEKIFYKIVCHHILYMCDFFINLDEFFVIICTGFLRRGWFTHDTLPIN